MYLECPICGSDVEAEIDEGQVEVKYLANGFGIPGIPAGIEWVKGCACYDKLGARERQDYEADIMSQYDGENEAAEEVYWDNRIEARLEEQAFGGER